MDRQADSCVPGPAQLEGKHLPLEITVSAGERAVLGYRADATWDELVNEATLREEAVDHLLSILAAAQLEETRSADLSGSFTALRLLCSEAAALHRGANRLIAMPTDTEPGGG